MFPIALRSRCSWRRLEGLFRRRPKFEKMAKTSAIERDWISERHLMKAETQKSPVPPTPNRIR